MFISKKKFNENYVKRSEYEALKNSDHFLEVIPGDKVYYLIFKDKDGKFCKEVDAEYVTIKEAILTEENFFRLYNKLYSTVFVDYSDALDYVNTFYAAD